MRIKIRVMNLPVLALLGLLLMPLSIEASLANKVGDYQNKNYQSVLDHYPFDRYQTLSHPEQYLLYKSLIKLGELERASHLIDHLEKAAQGPAKQIIKLERLEILYKQKDYTRLLQAMSQLKSDDPKSYLSRRVRQFLNKGFRNYKDKTFLLKALNRIYNNFPHFQKETSLLVLYYKSLPEGSRQRKETLVRLWMWGDVSRIPSRIRRKAKFIENNATSYRDILLEHFKSQNKHRNYTYLRKNIPRFLHLYQNRAKEDFSLLRDLYFRSMLKTRKYTLALRTLKNKASQLFFHFEEAEEQKWKFKFLMKKNHVKQAEDLARQTLKAGNRDEAFEMFYDIAQKFWGNQKYVEALHYYNRISLDEIKTPLQEKVQWRRFQLYDRLKSRSELIRIAIWARKHEFQSHKNGSKFCYWTFKLKLIKDHQALDCYKQYPFTYYGLKSKEVSSPYKQVYSQNLLTLPDTEIRKLNAEERYLLLFIDLLYSLNENKLADSLIHKEKQELAEFTWFHELGKILQKHQRFYLFHSLIAEHYDDLQEDNYYGPHVLPLNYPRAYEKHIRKYAKKTRVNEHLIYAVMREESRFRPYVKSGAGAVGLLQLMPATAKWIGKKERMRVRTWQLTDPKINIQLGSAYLKYLQKRFSGNNYYTLAAYNGGATHVKRWRKMVGKRDIDYFVEAITFSETQNYVKRVMKSYYLYQAIYAKHL